MKEQLAVIRTEQGLDLEIDTDDEIRAQIDEMIKFEQQLAALTNKRNFLPEETITFYNFEHQTGVWVCFFVKFDLQD